MGRESEYCNEKRVVVKSTEAVHVIYGSMGWVDGKEWSSPARKVFEQFGSRQKDWCVNRSAVCTVKMSGSSGVDEMRLVWVMFFWFFGWVLNWNDAQWEAQCKCDLIFVSSIRHYSTMYHMYSTSQYYKYTPSTYHPHELYQPMARPQLRWALSRGATTRYGCSASTARPWRWVRHG